MKISLFKQLLQAADIDLTTRKIIFVVEDKVLRQFYDDYGVSHEEFLESSELEDFVNNHIVSKLKKGVATMRSGKSYPNIKSLVLDRKEEGEITYLLVSNVFLIEDEKQTVLLSKLPYDIFSKMVIENNSLRGKNLVSLCLASTKINNMCNHRNKELFRKLLKLQFGIEGVEDPRNEYIGIFRRKVLMFGINRWSELGLKNERHRHKTTPTQISQFEGIIQVSCGEKHTTFLDYLGQVWTCGNGNNGQLGLGSDGLYTIPTKIRNFNKIRQISCGSDHTAFIDSMGQVWTFGKNFYGQLGLGDYNKYNVPTLIENFRDIKQISCGASHTAFIDSLGQIWMFGYYRQLPFPDNFQSIPIPTQVPNFKDVQQISCGVTHTIFIDSLGRIWTFGENHYGELGVNETMPGILFRVRGFKGIRQVSCRIHTAIIDSLGQVWTCGLNGNGQLGYESNLPRNFKFRMIPGFKDVKSIACGDYSTSIIDSQNRLWSCGANNYGQLGLGDKYPRTALTLCPSVSNVRQIACGPNHSAILI